MRRALQTILLAGLPATGALAVTADQYVAYLGLFAALAACLSVLTLGSVMPAARRDGPGARAHRAAPDPAS